MKKYKGSSKIWALPLLEDSPYLASGLSFVSPCYAVTQPYPEPEPVLADWYEDDLVTKHLDDPGKDWGWTFTPSQ